MSQWPGVPQEGVQPPSCRPPTPLRPAHPAAGPAHPAAGPYPLLGLQSGLFSVSRLSSSCRSSGPALRGTSSLQAQRTLRAHGWDSGGARLAPSTQPSQSAGCTREGCRGGPHQCWTSRPQPRCPDEPEGDEVGVEEGRTQEGAQQPQDGRARGHVPPPEPGQEGLERSRRCWPAAPHCSPHPALGWACTPGSSRSLARPPPPALPPGAPSCGARAFSARRPGSGSDTRGGNAMGPAEGVGGCLPGPEHPLPVSPTTHGWVVGGGWTAAAVWGKSARAPTACLPPHPGSPARPAAHLYPVVGEESLGVGLGGQVQAGGPAPAAAAADQQGEGAALAVAVALGEEAWPGGRPLARRPRHPPQPAPALACGTWLPTLLARPFRLLSGPWEPRAP